MQLGMLVSIRIELHAGRQGLAFGTLSMLNKAEIPLVLMASGKVKEA